MHGAGAGHRAIPFATAIAPIYARTVEDFAHSAAYIHEVSGGRFRFGIGVAHAPSHIRMGVTPGKPLGDIRAFVEKFRSYEGIGALPPIVLAALRKRMVALSAEIAAGRDLRQCQPLAHGGVAVGDPGRKARATRISWSPT